MIISTLCYLEKDGQYLMLHRNKKENDVNEGKWIGVGGKLIDGESPEDCVCREVLEETGLTLDGFKMRGILTFSSVGWEEEIIFVFTSSDFHGELILCDEGELHWVDKDNVMDLNLWEGDRVLMTLLLQDSPFFSLKFAYEGEHLADAMVRVY